MSVSVNFFIHVASRGVVRSLRLHLTQQRTMSVAREMLAAGPGCAVANGLLNGLETTKVKLQLQDATRPVYRQSTMMGVMRQIVREEGLVRGLLTPGLSASLMRSTVYGGWRVGLYPTIRDHLLRLSSLSSSSSSHSTTSVVGLRLASGMVTGAIGSLLTCPLDVLRTRMQADAGRVCSSTGVYRTGLRQGQRVRYPNLFEAFRHILRTDGLVSGLYRGAAVTVARASLLNGAQLSSYDTLKLWWWRRRRQDHRQLEGEDDASQSRGEGPLLHVACALASGVLAQTVIMPVDGTEISSLLL